MDPKLRQGLYLTVRIDEERLDTYEFAAMYVGKKLSAWVKDTLDRAAARRKPPGKQ